MIERVMLGDSGIEVSSVCLGTMYFGVKVEETLAHRLMDIYYERGGRFFDTANKYASWVPGFEEPVGEGMISRWLSSRKHRDVLVATKVGYSYQDVPQSLRKEIIMQEVEKSLQQLGVECIDLLYAHADDYETPQEEYLQAFDTLVKEGKVRVTGISNVTSWRLARADILARQHEWQRFCCVQARLSYLWPNTDADFGRQIPATPELLEMAAYNGLRVLCYSPLLQGCFGRRDRAIPAVYANEYNRESMALVQLLAERYGVSGNTLVLSWLMEQGYIPLVTGSREEQVVQNCEAETGLLTPEDLGRLNERFYPKWLHSVVAED